MARIEPKMLCLIKKDGEVKGMVSTIRKETTEDCLPTGNTAWLCTALGDMKANRLLQLPALGGIHINLGAAMMPAGSEGWVSECYLHPLPGLDDDEETDKEAPIVKEREHEPAV